MSWSVDLKVYRYSISKFMFRRFILLAAFTLLASSYVEADVAFSPKSSLRTIRDDASITPKNSVASFSRKGITEIQGGATGGQSTMSKSIFNLVKGIVGVGVLSLPSGTLGSCLPILHCCF